MKRILLLAAVLLLVASCSSNYNDQLPVVDGNHPVVDGDQGAMQETHTADADMDLVNFKCELAGVETYYFFKGKIKLETSAQEGWIIDKVYYVKTDINGEAYLVTGMMDPDVTADDLKNMYRTSKTTPGFDCEEGAASEADVTLPDLPVITNDELAQKMMGGMGLS